MFRIVRLPASFHLMQSIPSITRSYGLFTHWFARHDFIGWFEESMVFNGGKAPCLDFPFWFGLRLCIRYHQMAMDQNRIHFVPNLSANLTGDSIFNNGHNTWGLRYLDILWNNFSARVCWALLMLHFTIDGMVSPQPRLCVFFSSEAHLGGLGQTQSQVGPWDGVKHNLPTSNMFQLHAC